MSSKFEDNCGSNWKRILITATNATIVRCQIFQCTIRALLEMTWVSNLMRSLKFVTCWAVHRYTTTIIITPWLLVEHEQCRGRCHPSDTWCLAPLRLRYRLEEWHLLPALRRRRSDRFVFLYFLYIWNYLSLLYIFIFYSGVAKLNTIKCHICKMDNV